jgi:hypothetical protein
MSLQKVSSAPSPEKLKALDLALSAIEKQFGKGAIMKLDNKSVVEKMAVIPTGCLSLDLALGIGVFLKVVLSKFTGQNLLVKQLLLYILQLNAKNKVEQLLS